MSAGITDTGNKLEVQMVAGGSVSLGAITARKLFVQAPGDINDGAALTLTNLQLVGQDILFDQTHSVSNIAASGRSISFQNAGALAIETLTTALSSGSVTTSGLSAVGGTRPTATSPYYGFVFAQTLSGNLSVNANVTSDQNSLASDIFSRTNTPSIYRTIFGVGIAEPIYLIAGANAAAGTSTGGEVIVGSNTSISAGANARALIFTGSISGTGVVPGGIGINTRYTVSKAFISYGAVSGNELGARLTTQNGISVLYRETPTVAVSVDDATLTYGDISP